ncbi:right-handed parallel beta-helix repeat-containing protein [Bacteroidota bacterium]
MKLNCLPSLSRAGLLPIVLITFQALSQNHTIPGKLYSPYPTLVNLALEWLIDGDDNLNGSVEIEFRIKGSSEWKQGMPLRRVPAGENIGFQWANKHSGSIFDLLPDTEYEIKLSLNDPDGGSEKRLLVARTRPIPAIDENATIIDLKPGSYDTLKTNNGTKNNPMVYRCSKGIATFSHIDMLHRKWVYIDGLHIENLKKKGRGIKMNGAENCMVKNCTINAIYGIVAYLPGAKNCYICDNIITGISVWTNEAMGAHGKNIGEGIEITGPGNVICYNKVTGFRDCISTMEDQWAVDQTCIDIYNNDIYGGADDGIEADFCFSNCRIFRNRLTNCYVGLSSQPGLGGPTYFIRNAMYNMVHAAFKLKRFSQGDVVIHNTVIKVGTGLGGNSKMDHAFFRNNLAIGGPTGGINWGDFGAGNPYAADIIDPGDHSDFDYDAIGVYNTPYIARIGNKPFTDIESNGIERLVLAEVFPNIDFPIPPIPERKVPDLRPSFNSVVVDMAIWIPNINDIYQGKAPDCGAYEAGQKLPHYGPRKSTH